MTILPITRRRFWQRWRPAWQSWWYGAHYCCAGTALETMKMGICKDDLAPSLGRADESSCCNRRIFRGRWQKWQKPGSACTLEWRCGYAGRYGGENAQPGDHILVMSNGGFGGIHQNCWMVWRRRRKLRSNSASAYIVCVGRIRRSRRIRHLSIVLMRRLMRLIRPTGAPHPANQLTSTTKITLHSPPVRADTGNLACGFRRLIPFFLFLRVADRVRSC